MKKGSYKIFTDGASKGNPGPGGYGAIVFGPESVVELGGRSENTTNNKMELTAPIEALTKTPVGSVVQIFSDSQYVINGITKWVFGWEKNGWITKEKKEVLNKPLWIKLQEEVKKRAVSWVYVAGHQGTPANERVDEIASTFAEDGEVNLYAGSRDAYRIPDTVPKSGLQKTKKGSVYGYVSVVDGVSEIHTTWNECKERVAGKTNPKYRKVYSKQEAEDLISKWTN